MGAVARRMLKKFRDLCAIQAVELVMDGPPETAEQAYYRKGLKHHRWSGWPGAWCLDCGIADPFEECIGSCDIPCDSNGMPIIGQCKIHAAGAPQCPSYMKGLFDPYKTKSTV
jgi:hypothetical protein